MSQPERGEPTVLSPYQLTDELYLASAKILRAAAEIEDIVNLTVAQFADLSESKASVLLGRSPLAARIRIARKLGSLRKDAALKAFDKAFEPPFKDFLRLRNTLAHGALLGVNDDGDIFFQTNEVSGFEDDAVVAEAIGWPPATIKFWGDKAEEYVEYIETTLQLRDKRQGQERRELLGARISQAIQSPKESG